MKKLRLFVSVGVAVLLSLGVTAYLHYQKPPAAKLIKIASPAVDTSGILQIYISFQRDGKLVARCNEFGSGCTLVGDATLDDLVASWKETSLAYAEGNTLMWRGWHKCENELNQRGQK